MGGSAFRAHPVGLGFCGHLALLGMMCSLTSTRLRWVAGRRLVLAAVAALRRPLKLNILVAIAVAVPLCLALEACTPLHDPPRKRAEALNMATLLDVDLRTVFIIVALAGISVVSRSLFFLSRNDWSLPAGVQRGLQYAPIAALAAVIARRS